MWFKEIEFIASPFKDEAIVDLRIANIVAEKGEKVHLYFLNKLKEVIEQQAKGNNLIVTYVDIDYDDVERYYQRMIGILKSKYCSNKIMIGRPQRDLEKTSMNYVENILFNFGLDIETTI